MATTQFTISYDDNGIPQIQGLTAQQQNILLAAAQKNPAAQQIVKQGAQIIQKELQENKKILQQALREGTEFRSEAIVLLEEYSSLEKDIQFILNEGFLDTAKDKAKDLYAKAGAAVTTAGTVAKQGLEKLGQFTKEHPTLIKALALAAVVGLAFATTQQAAASDMLGNINKSINGVQLSSTPVWGTDGSDILSLVTQYQKAIVEGDTSTKQTILSSLKQLINGVLVIGDGRYAALTANDVAQFASSNPNDLNWLNQAIVVTKNAINLTTSPVAQGLKKAAMIAATKTF